LIWINSPSKNTLPIPIQYKLGVFIFVGGLVFSNYKYEKIYKKQFEEGGGGGRA